MIIIIISLNTNGTTDPNSIRSSYRPWLIFGEANFAVDSKNRTYLEANSVHDENGHFLYSYQAQHLSYDSLSFYLDENDNIVISPDRSSLVYVYNEDDLINTIDDSNRDINNHIPSSSTIRTKSGDIYHLSRISWYTKIVRISNGTTEVVYRISFHFAILWSYFVMNIMKSLGIL